MGTIELEQMEFFSYHGCYEQEQVVGNYFLVDLKFNTDSNAAIKSDDINDTVSYLTIYELIKDEMKKKSKLLEHVAGRIIDRLYTEFPEKISDVTIKIRKMNPPLGGKLNNVSVTLTQ
ncbi:MAG: dihydroneopterin aldolase [Salinivirgaceae bacterium]|nr:dihydroneopterin aldolase [Salinivirgaceae bacterium]MDD4748255.1 dihydroneopterin aldolase [Salinivirgaceae bacterium]MDY0280403.1 dihydroneopterin aldolase [Salinivirgaceae bacterium]